MTIATPKWNETAEHLSFIHISEALDTSASVSLEEVGGVLKGQIDLPVSFVVPAKHGIVWPEAVGGESVAKTDHCGASYDVTFDFHARLLKVNDDGSAIYLPNVCPTPDKFFNAYEKPRVAR